MNSLVFLLDEGWDNNMSVYANERTSVKVIMVKINLIEEVFSNG